MIWITPNWTKVICGDLRVFPLFRTCYFCCFEVSAICTMPHFIANGVTLTNFTIYNYKCQIQSSSSIEFDFWLLRRLKYFWCLNKINALAGGVALFRGFAECSKSRTKVEETKKVDQVLEPIESSAVLSFYPLQEMLGFLESVLSPLTGPKKYPCPSLIHCYQRLITSFHLWSARRAANRPWIMMIAHFVLPALLACCISHLLIT